MHSFIQEINEARRDGKDLRPLNVMTKELEKSWNKAGYHSKIQRERRLALGKKSLANFYNQAKKDPAPTQVEEKFRINLAEDVVLHGRIDAVFEQEGVEIRDYKTGFAAKTQESANRNAGDSQQLELYALAWLLQRDEMPAKLSLYYLDTNLIGVTTRKQRQTLETRHQKLLEAVENLKKGIYPLGNSHRYCIHP